MRTSLVLGALATATLVAACSKAPAADDQLTRDLEAASLSTLELAPNTKGTVVVSDAELKQPSQPKVTPVRRAKTPQPEPETRQVTQTSHEPVAVAPLRLPASSVSTPRGARSTSDVIRNAPFPINPATTTKRP